MDIGPYQYVGFWAFPSHALREHNPMAAQCQLVSMPKNVVNGCGTCAHCGRAISHVYLVKSATGKVYGVGCDCIDRTGDKSLGDAVAVAAARLAKEQRREKRDIARQVRHNAWLATVCNDRGETNQQRLDRESAEKKAAELARVSSAISKWGWLIEVLRDGKGGFRDSVANGLAAGYPPSPRAWEICADIYAKTKGRNGSKAYADAIAEFEIRAK